VEILQSITANAWTAFLIVLFLGGSIFVHELGHFVIARRRGMVVECFSLGFGPALWSRRGRDGVEYRLAVFPFGGYVRLPQLAALGGIEGESTTDTTKLPAPSYGTLMMVFVAGVTGNIILAYALAGLLWAVGQPSSEDLATTRIGYIQAKLEQADGPAVTSPAAEAGLQIGDTVRAIDGRAVGEWQDLVQTLMTSAGRAADGTREAVFTIERQGRMMDITLHPRLAGEEHMRRVGIAPAYEPIVFKVEPDSIAAAIGLKAEDHILALDGTPVLNLQTYGDIMTANPNRELALKVRRGKDHAVEVTLTIPARPDAKEPDDIGAEFISEPLLAHPSPIKLVNGFVSMTFRTMGSLLNPRSDVGLSKLSGPVGIAHVFSAASQVDVRLVLWFAILVNVNLAIFNLLPIPVLDGGHMLFATIGRLRGQALPTSFIACAQNVFLVLLISMVIYVSIFDLGRWHRDAQIDRPAAPVPGAGAAPAK
jgi:regulator of sigma E protease